MQIILKKNRSHYFEKQRGFVLPFTMFVSAIMLLISTSVALIFSKQMYFSNIARESQRAYYAADSAVACALSVDETFVDINGVGILPNDATLSEVDTIQHMRDILTYVNEHRAAMIPAKPALAGSIESIECGQSTMFDVGSPNNFEISPVKFTRDVPPSDDFPLGTTEDGVTSTFNMKMNLGGGVYRCAKVTVNKTPSYRQVVAQGYAECNRPSGTVERAVVDTTIIQ